MVSPPKKIYSDFLFEQPHGNMPFCEVVIGKGAPPWYLPFLPRETTSATSCSVPGQHSTALPDGVFSYRKW